MPKKSFKEKSVLGKLLTVVTWTLIGFIALIVLIIIIAPKEDSTKPSNNSSVVQEDSKSRAVDEVRTALDTMDDEFKGVLAATRVDGYQGEIVGVEADGDDNVIVKVTTHFTDPNDGEDGGKNIARKIFSNVCLDSPSLRSLYVKSTTSGYDSRSVYRGDIPGCKTE